VVGPGTGRSNCRLKQAHGGTFSILTTLAADAKDQVAWLDRYWLETDDLALDYENAQASIAVLAEAGRIDPAMESRLARIDAILDRMSGLENAPRWSYEALTSDPGWIKLRQLAREALEELAGTWRQPLPTLWTFSPDD
jgi:hypothetical protein